MSVRENIEAGKYENNVPHKIERVPVNDNMTLKQAREHDEAEDRRRREQRDKNHAEHARLVRLFRSDIEEEHGVAGHPKATMLWEKAWERGHSGGWSEVCWTYEDLVELIT